MERRIEETPQNIVEGGRIRMGVFRTPFRNMNLLEADTLGGKMMRRFRLKEWTHYGIIHPEWYFGMLIMDVKYSAQSFFFAYNRATGKLTEHSCLKLDRNVRVSENQWNDKSWFRHSGYRMDFFNHLEASEHKITVEIATKRGNTGIRAAITLNEDLLRVQPMIVSLPVGPNRCMYSHKAPMTAGGTVHVGSEGVVLDPARDLAIIDEHKILPVPYDMAVGDVRGPGLAGPHCGREPDEQPDKGSGPLE
jgi:hypothetical protein